MNNIDFLTDVHTLTKRDYLGRVNDKEFPKYKAAKLAKKWAYDYWDGDRRINYGGYKYIPGRWAGVAKKLIEYYKLTENSSVLDIGCGKGFLLYELKKILPSINIAGLDISEYAIENSKEEIKKFLKVGNATKLNFKDNNFDLAFSINTFHNLYNYELINALTEIERVAKHKYICVESYRNEEEKQNLLYWQVTCEIFCNPDEWLWWFKTAKYTGDYSFIFFE